MTTHKLRANFAQTPETNNKTPKHATYAYMA